MGVLEAVRRVLSEAREPLHYREITRRMISGGLWSSGGKTPWATVNAQLSSDINRRGTKCPFRREGPGTYALNEDTSPKTGDSITGTVSATPVSFTRAAEEVLERFADRKPMHYRDITAKALELGLIVTSGQTPEATMNAQILTEIQRQQRRGKLPRFTRHGRGLVGLTRWQATGLAHQIEQHNNEVRRRLYQRVRQMEPAEFEALIGRLLTAMGFESVQVTSRSSDGGIDVRGVLVVGAVIATKMAVQVKRWKRNIQASTVQQVRGSLGAHEQGLIITTSDFSKGAREEAVKPDATPVALMSGEELVSLLVEHDIGVRRQSHDLVELYEGEEET